MASNAINSSRTKTNQNIQVYVRLRPTNDRERSIRSTEVVSVPSTKEVMVRSIMDSKTTKKFTFDRTFGPDSTQSEVYQSVVHPLIDEVLAGYNCTVFAYGQTGTGKTHTMIGEERPMIGSSWDDSSELGIIPRALSHLFEELRLMEMEFSMRVSFLELYNEELTDLLSSNDSNPQIRIYDDASKKGSIIVHGLEEIPVHNTSDVYKLLAKGQENRKTASTLMNSQSSRSHTIFSILVHIKENGLDGEELLKIGKLNLVDLAGSENISKAGNEKGIRTRESVNINQSLLTLGRVITALVERTPHIPYRESKLTRLLQESLGGRTKTSIIATISPGCKDAEETLSTLEYAHRAKNIQNKPELNQKLFKKTVLKAYTEEIDRLKRDLVAARDKNGIFLPEETYNEMQYRMEMQNKELNEKMQIMKALKDEMASKISLFNEVSLNLINKTEELNVAQSVLSDTRENLSKTQHSLSTTRLKYKEKKHLLDKHIKTEELLTSQATELINVCESVSNHTYSLHESIERRNESGQQLKFVCSNFSSSLDQKLNSMHGSVNEMISKHSQHLKNFHDNILSSKREYDEFSNKASFNIQSLLDYNQQFSDEQTKSMGKYETMMNGLNVDQQTSIKNMIQELTENQTTFLNGLKEKFSLITNAFDAQKCNINKHNEQIIENVTILLSDINGSYEQQKMARNNFAQELLTEFKKNVQFVQEAFEENVQIDTELETVQKLIENIRSKKQLNNHKFMNYSNNVAEIENNIQTNQARTNEINVENQNNFNQKCQHLIENVKAEDLEMKKQIDINENTVKDCIDQVNANDIEHTEGTTELQKLNEKQTQDLQANYVDAFKVFNDVEQQRHNQFNQNISKLQTLVIDQNSKESYSFGNLLANTSICDEIVNKFGVEANGDFTDCLSRTKQFIQNDVKVYHSTGETPMKQIIQYPTELATTSPHERIIRRFRNTYQSRIAESDQSANISELDENFLLDDSIDMPSFSSSIEQNESFPLQERQINRFNDMPSVQMLQPPVTPSQDKLLKPDYFAVTDRENKENSRGNSLERKQSIKN